jgi:predicted CxxxxCH...CXXCH cytochrome family protein
VFPDVAGRHSTHNALSGVTGICTACHDTFDSGTQSHYDHANARPGKDALRVSPGEAAFLATYNAKSGAASFSATALTCSNVSCHGGQTTPNWQTGTLDVNTQCTSCHASGTAQYNSYNSGRHNQGNHVSNGCTSCHDTARLAPGHFTNLATATVFEQAPSATLRTALQYNGTSCNPEAGGLSGCHDSKTW